MKAKYLRAVLTSWSILALLLYPAIRWTLATWAEIGPITKFKIAGAITEWTLVMFLLGIAAEYIVRKSYRIKIVKRPKR